ncbi:MAG TPA: hypothetical protein VHO24_06830 [Opitutaceae bacterium]|nr:hypothetical protein [Opitutaceae bacterium]
MRPNHFVFNGSFLLRFLSATIVFLLVANIATQVAKLEFGHRNLLGFVHTFSLDGEGAAGAYFSSLQLFIAACLLTVIAKVERNSAGYGRYWVVLAIGFYLLSLDEAVALHERLVDPMRALLGKENLGLLYYGWIVPGAIGAAAVGLYFLPFLFRLPIATRRQFVLAASLFLGGAVGVEALEGRYFEQHGLDDFGFSLYIFIEEGMEMTGILVFIRGLLGYLRGICPTVTIVVDPAAQAEGRAGPLGPPD